MGIRKKIIKSLYGLSLAILLSSNIVYAAEAEIDDYLELGENDDTRSEDAEDIDDTSDSDAVDEADEESEGRIDSETDRTGVLEDVINSDPAEAQAPIMSKPDVDAPYHKNFEYSSDIVLQGAFQTNTYFFLIEDYWNYEYAYAEIQIDVSRLISSVPASLTFMVNDIPVVSYLVDYENGRSQVFYVEIPTRLLRAGYNSFDIAGYARIFDEEGCLDDFTGANWVSIRRESYIQVGYDIKYHEHKISNFPYPFISSIDNTGKGSYVATSDAMTGPELEAAISLRSKLSAKTDHEDQIHLIVESDMPGAADGIILVSEYDNLSSENRSIIDAQAASNEIDDKAIVLFTERNGTPMLLITSKDSACLMEAVCMLMDDDRVSQEAGSVAFVDKGGIALMRELLAENMTASGRYTLDALAERGIEIIGPYHQEAVIYLPFSGGYVLSEVSKVSLNYRYSENLNFDHSMVTVYWGDIPVASKKLTLEHAGGDELSFTMPSDVIGTHADSIRIAFELELPELFCTPRMEDMPWAYISDESVFYLPVGENTEYRFELRPYPFEKEEKFNDLVIVIPDEMGSDELQALGLLMSVYGESLAPYGNIKVVKAKDMTDELKEHHLIVFGTYNDNSYVRELNGYLGFQFNEKGSAYMSNSSLVLSNEYSREIVTMQLFGSPFGVEKAVLVCSAVSPERFKNLTAFLEQDENVWTLSEDTVLIDNDLDIKVYDMHERGVSSDIPVLKRLLEQNRDSTIFAIVAVSVMSLFLLSVILILIRVYWNQRKK